ncbi:hemerythrin domain-containing protein [Anaeroarcus burkinensis]|uniref:hemerythrin domain-containing protein n=1 Tax=Anaeroarcus burkinensis TaxID=82376 RepID=UPI00040D99F1|nr:hemerythrin domain-containing protein [Anaeroarcus burkinensis]
MDIKNILRQHDEVFALIKQVRAYQNQEQVREHAFEISKAVAQLAGILKVHLSSEDKFVYPVLVKHQEAAIRTTAETFANEMGELFKVFDAYKTKYMGASKIAENAAAFLDETKTVFLALETRIDKENMSLYPLLK